MIETLVDYAFKLDWIEGFSVTFYHCVCAYVSTPLSPHFLRNFTYYWRQSQSYTFSFWVLIFKCFAFVFLISLIAVMTDTVFLNFDSHNRNCVCVFFFQLVTRDKWRRALLTHLYVLMHIDHIHRYIFDVKSHPLLRIFYCWFFFFVIFLPHLHLIHWYTKTLS